MTRADGINAVEAFTQQSVHMVPVSSRSDTGVMSQVRPDSIQLPDGSQGSKGNSGGEGGGGSVGKDTHRVVMDELTDGLQVRLTLDDRGRKLLV